MPDDGATGTMCSRERLLEIRAALFADDVPLPSRPLDEVAAEKYFEFGGDMASAPSPRVPLIHHLATLTTDVTDGQPTYSEPTAEATLEELVKPPLLPTVFQPIKPSGTDATSRQLDLGIAGSRIPRCSELLDMIARAGPNPDYEASFLLWTHVISRRLADPYWCSAFAHAAEQIARAGGGSSGTAPAAILVLGLGTAVPALVAARCGATVTWAERSPRLAELARRLVRRNGLASNVRIVECSEWDQLRGPAHCFDGVLTEDFDEEDLSKGAPRLAWIVNRAREHWLRRGGGGRVVPQRAVMVGQCGSVRTTCVADGIDLRAMNALRGAAASAAFDVEHLAASDFFRREQPRMLSEPFVLRVVVDATDPSTSSSSFTTTTSSSSTSSLGVDGSSMVASASVTHTGVLNCVSTWAELDLGGGCTYSAAPDWQRPRPIQRRALSQPLRYLGCECLVERGEGIRLRLSHGASTLILESPAEGPAEGSAPPRRVPWPCANAFACNVVGIELMSRLGPSDQSAFFLTDHA